MRITSCQPPTKRLTIPSSQVKWRTSVHGISARWRKISSSPRTPGDEVSLAVVSTELFVNSLRRHYGISSSSDVVGSWGENGFTCRVILQTSNADFSNSSIRDIKGLYGLPHLAINLWIVGVFTLAITVINLPLVAVDSSLTPLWVAICADFCFITFYVSLPFGYVPSIRFTVVPLTNPVHADPLPLGSPVPRARLCEIGIAFFSSLGTLTDVILIGSQGQKWWKIPIHLICSIVIQPFASIAEGLSAIWAMSSEDFGYAPLLHLRCHFNELLLTQRCCTENSRSLSRNSSSLSYRTAFWCSAGHSPSAEGGGRALFALDNFQPDKFSRSQDIELLSVDAHSLFPARLVLTFSFCDTPTFSCSVFGGYSPPLHRRCTFFWDTD